MFLGRIPLRFSIGIMLFFGPFINYMMRVNMSVNIIAMVNRKTSNITSMKNQCEGLTNYSTGITTNTEQQFMQRELVDDVKFDWTEQHQAQILSAYFWGYAVACVFGGLAADRWGPRKVVFITMMIITIMTILCPLAARISYIGLIIVRVISGAAGGFLYPSLHVLVAHWAPPDEKGKFVSAMLGGTIGTVVTWSLTGPLIEKFGWDYAFYVPGAIAFFWCILWWFSIYNTPVEHPRISETEKMYILHAIGKRVYQKKGKIKTPFKQILTSSPYLAMVILLFGSNWGLYFVLTAAPKFMSSALGFNLSTSGALASLPYLLRMISSLFFGLLGDRLTKSNTVSLKFIRKFFCLFSHIIPGILLISVGYAGCSPYLAVALISLTLGFNGAATLTNLVNHQDLAPNFAGTLFGIANGIGNVAGLLTPLVTAHFTQNGNGFAEWRSIFLVGGSMYIATAIYFIIFSSADTQTWNYIACDVEKNTDNVDKCIKDAGSTRVK